MSEPTEARVREIIINELGVEPEKATDDASFVEDLGADSRDTVELVMALEEEFGRPAPPLHEGAVLAVLPRWHGPRRSIAPIACRVASRPRGASVADRAPAGAFAAG